VRHLAWTRASRIRRIGKILKVFTLLSHLLTSYCCRQLEEQLQVARNQRYMAKWTLRELSLKAVIENKFIIKQLSLSSASALRVHNLREWIDSLF
jgi:hypothetical protein